jgi:hypothetical protein
LEGTVAILVNDVVDVLLSISKPFSLVELSDQFRRSCEATAGFSHTNAVMICKPTRTKSLRHVIGNFQASKIRSLSGNPESRISWPNTGTRPDDEAHEACQVYDVFLVVVKRGNLSKNFHRWKSVNAKTEQICSPGNWINLRWYEQS